MAAPSVAELRVAAVAKYAALIEDMGLPPRSEAEVLALLDAIQEAGGKLPAGLEPPFAYPPPFLVKFGAAWRAANDHKLAAAGLAARKAPPPRHALVVRETLMRNLMAKRHGIRSGTSDVKGASGTGGAAAAPHAHSSTHEWSVFVPDKAQAPLQSGVGAGHKARWTSCGLDVAVKVLHAAKLSDVEYADAVAKLELEAELMCVASMHGANRFIVPQLGIVRGAPTDAWIEHLGSSIAAHVGVGGELIGLAMAWEDGGSLMNRLHGPTPWRASTHERLLLLERVAEGVALLHDNEPTFVVHGDLRPANVLLTDDGLPQLSDFGLSASRAACSKGEPSLMSTRIEHAAGTFPYMAPEMYQDGDVAALTASPATDVNAYGTLAWETLVGKLPWDGVSEPDRVRALHAGKLLDFGRIPADAPVGLRALLELCVSADSGRRPRAREVRDKIRKLQPPPNPFANYYPNGPGVALLFADEHKEARFAAQRGVLARALEGRGFAVVLLAADSILIRLRAELERVKKDTSLRRVLFGFSGHGCTALAHPAGLLQESCGALCRVAEIEDVLSRAFPARGEAAVPKLLVLDCCFCNIEGATPPAWVVDPEPENTPHDIAILGAASKGKYGYSDKDGSFSFSHALAEAIGNEALLDLKDVQRSVKQRLEQRGGKYADLQPTFDDTKLNCRFSFHEPRNSKAAAFSDDEVVAARAELRKPEVTLERAIELLCNYAGYPEVGVDAADAIAEGIKRNGALWPASKVAKAAEPLVALASTPTVCDNADAARCVAAALNNIACSAEGNKACVDTLAPVALIKLAGTLAVHQSAGAAKIVCKALFNISSRPDGHAAYSTAEARAALAALAAAPKVSVDAEAAEWVGKARSRIQATATTPPAASAASALPPSAAAAPVPPASAAAAAGGGNKLAGARASAVIGASPNGIAAPRSAADKAAALAELGAASVAPARAIALLHAFDGDASVGVAAAIAIKVAARCAEGQAACVAAGAAATLVQLASAPAVRASAAAAQHVAAAFTNLSASAVGAGACVAAGAVPALVALSYFPAVHDSAGAAEHVATALAAFAGSAEVQAACAAICAAPALVALSSASAVRGSSGAAKWTARALASIALLPDGKAACAAAGARAALAALAAAPAVADNIDAAVWVGEALKRL